MTVPQRPSTRRKYRAVQKRFKQLYDGKRIRHDDCIKLLQKEFFISDPTHVGKILRLDVPSEAEYYQSQLTLDLVSEDPENGNDHKD